MQAFSPRVSWMVRVLSLAACLCLGVMVGVSFERLRAASGFSGFSSASSTRTHDGRVLGQGQLPPAGLVSRDVDFRIFWEVWKDIKDRYYEQPIKDQDLLYGALMLSSLSSIDYVTIFSQDTPEKLIREVKPDVLVKGGDWKAGQIVGRDVAKKVLRVPLVKGRSTTDLIQKIVRLYAQPK
jgi:hypothetical protein